MSFAQKILYLSNKNCKYPRTMGPSYILADKCKFLNILHGNLKNIHYHAVRNVLHTSSSIDRVSPPLAAVQVRHYTNRNILNLHQRGLWKDRFPEACEAFDKSLLNGSTQTVYAGFDPTADSLHIGNLLVLISLLHCQRAGHTPIVLLGGFTSTVGDPSGRSGSRSDLPSQTAAENTACITTSVKNIFGNHDRIFWKNKDESQLKRPIFVNNNDWLSSLSLSDLITVMKDLSALSMLRSSYIKDRINDHKVSKLKGHELMYQVLQAYDWLHLYDKYNCKIQIGGSDQMANIWLGHELIKDTRKDSVTGLTVPLVTTESGEKLGKSAGNALWLSQNKTSYFDFYQFFLRRTDSEVETMLKLFTFLSLGEIKKLMQRHWEKPESQPAQKKLAEAVTLLVHGEYGLQVALNSTDVLYHNKATALLDMTNADLESMFSGVVTKLPLQPGTTVLEAAMAAKCFPNNRDCEATIRAGGFSINQCKVQQPHLALITGAHVLPSGYSLLRVGKRNYTLVHWQQ